jgi:hypothetical protein
MAFARKEARMAMFKKSFRLFDAWILAALLSR